MDDGFNVENRDTLRVYIHVSLDTFLDRRDTSSLLIARK